MYRLYWSPSTGAFAPEAVLNEIGARYERVLVDTRENQHRESDFLQLNPRGQVPVLELPDGSVMTESAAMILTLCELHPEAGLLPPQGQSARAQAYRWLFFAVANIYEADLRYSYNGRYTVDPMGGEAVQRQAEKDLDTHWRTVEQALSEDGRILPDSFSAVDIYLAMLAVWHHDIPRLLSAHPRLARLVERVRGRPALVALWTEHFGHKTLG